MTFEGNPSFASKHKFLQQYAHPGSFFGCFYSEDRERVIFERSFSWVQMMLLALGLTVGMLCLIMAVRQLVVLSKVLTENRERAPEGPDCKEFLSCMYLLLTLLSSLSQMSQHTRPSASRCWQRRRVDPPTPSCSSRPRMPTMSDGAKKTRRDEGWRNITTSISDALRRLQR